MPRNARGAADVSRSTPIVPGLTELSRPATTAQASQGSFRDRRVVSRLVQVVVVLFCPLGIILLVCIGLMWAKSTAEHRPAPAGLGYAALAFMCLVAAAIVWGVGGVALIQPEVDLECSARGAGEFVGYESSELPLRGELVCAEGTFQMVPPWVNPVLFTLLAGVPALLATAVLVWRRRRSTGSLSRN
ncbi:hypothetical protein SAMN05216298_0662 [Glycomyces sambucus]|uniref:Uncharacterized protein n=1 Tax=Glycomyces sambucus TaxID=380244 RepID=A0A1G9D495_9ACTN|nr:hypothetical protein [Glycomyces sambucus]SDK58514.1 hypothetical protein SAMN05216298_0662 [Glycomyces sambucus]